MYRSLHLAWLLSECISSPAFWDSKVNRLAKCDESLTQVVENVFSYTSITSVQNKLYIKLSYLQNHLGK